MKKVLFILAFLGLSSTRIFSQTAGDFYNRGLEKQKANDDSSAIIEFNKAIELNPK